MEKINHKISIPCIHAAYPRGLNEVREKELAVHHPPNAWLVAKRKLAT